MYFKPYTQFARKDANHWYINKKAMRLHVLLPKHIDG